MRRGLLALAFAGTLALLALVSPPGLRHLGGDGAFTDGTRYGLAATLPGRLQAAVGMSDCVEVLGWELPLPVILWSSWLPAAGWLASKSFRRASRHRRSRYCMTCAYGMPTTNRPCPECGATAIESTRHLWNNARSWGKC